MRLSVLQLTSQKKPSFCPPVVLWPSLEPLHLQFFFCKPRVLTR